MKLEKNMKETDEQLAISTKEQESIKKKIKWNFPKRKIQLNSTDGFNSSLYTTDELDKQEHRSTKNILILYEA